MFPFLPHPTYAAALARIEDLHREAATARRATEVAAATAGTAQSRLGLTA